MMESPYIKHCHEHRDTNAGLLLSATKIGTAQKKQVSLDIIRFQRLGSLMVKKKENN